jgi:hypothetical protein
VASNLSKKDFKAALKAAMLSCPRESFISDDKIITFIALPRSPTEIVGSGTHDTPFSPDTISINDIRRSHGYEDKDYSSDEEESLCCSLIPSSSSSSSALCSSSSSSVALTLQRVQEEMKCAICHELLFEPVLLACGHSFCRYCLRESLCAASCLPGQSGTVRRCCSCRQALCGCTLSLPVSILLKNTIKLLFPEEYSRRQREHFARVSENRLGALGENSGVHSRGFEILSPCDENWIDIGMLRASATRNLVLDSDDRCRRIVLSVGFAVRGSKLKRNKVACLDDKITLNIFVLNVEEDEINEELPFLLRVGGSVLEGGDDDASLIMHTHNAPLALTVAGIRFSWTATLNTLAGATSFTVPLGDSPGEYLITATDSLSHAEIRVRLPVAPVSGRRDGNSDTSSGEDGHESEEEDLDTFESDGFVVDDEEECDDGGSDSEEGEQIDICLVCSCSTAGCDGAVLICEGCEGEAHLACTGEQEVPSGDWFCHACDGTSSHHGISTNSRKSKHNDGNDDDDDDDDDNQLPVAKKRSKQRNGLLCDSDEDGC